MAFKTIEEYNDERYGNFFMLKNDGDTEDVIILYRSLKDVLVADTHYIKSEEYSGYVHCLGGNISCPACKRGIRVQPKLFIPLYVLSTGEVLFWDRSVRFQQQLEQEVFNNFANPTEYVFRITRHGAAGDQNTRYAIQAVYRNKSEDLTYESILKTKGIALPDYYDVICKEWDAVQYNRHLHPSDGGSNSNVNVDDMPEYKLTPRKVVQEVELPDLDMSDGDDEDSGKVKF